MHNPFKSEADAFRVLIMFVVAGALVIALGVFVSGLVAALVGLVLLAVGLWRAWGMVRTWHREGSEPR